MSSVVISNFHAIIFEHHQIFQEMTAPHVEKRDIPLWMLIVCKKYKLVAMLYRTAATSQICVLESLYIRQRSILNWPKGIVCSHLQLKLQPQRVFQIFRRLGGDRTFKGSPERTNCLIYPYRGEEMNPWPFRNQSRDFLDFVKLVHRKKTHLLLMSR